MLPPKTSAGKYLCGDLYNETEVTARSWSIVGKKKIDNLTKRSLKLSEVNTTKYINLQRSRRSRVESVSVETAKKNNQNIRSSTILPKFFLKKLYSKVNLNISAHANI